MKLESLRKDSIGMINKTFDKIESINDENSNKKKLEKALFKKLKKIHKDLEGFLNVL